MIYSICSPYKSLNFAQWSHSKLSGISKKLPRRGHPRGPGGKGNGYLYFSFVTRMNKNDRIPKTRRRDTVISERYYRRYGSWDTWFKYAQSAHMKLSTLFWIINWDFKKKEKENLSTFRRTIWKRIRICLIEMLLITVPAVSALGMSGESELQVFYHKHRFHCSNVLILNFKLFSSPSLATTLNAGARLSDRKRWTLSSALRRCLIGVMIVIHIHHMTNCQCDMTPEIALL